MARYIGIRHRTKKTAKGDARPTQVVIIDGDETTGIELETETDELDFVLDRYPTAWRNSGPEEDLSIFLTRHVLPVKGSDEKKVPAAFEGLKAGDIVAMSLGGSGDRFASALSRRGEKIGATVIRIPPSDLKAARGEEPKDKDAEVLARLALENRALFYTTTARERQIIMVRESLQQMVDAMKARIACEQRLRQRLIGKIFCNPEGLYPEGAIEDEFDAEKARDTILQALLKEEAGREKELKKALEGLDIYTELFQPVEGVGPRIAARLIAAIMDIRRFEVKPDQSVLEDVNRRIEIALQEGDYYADKPTVAALHDGDTAFEEKYNGLERVGQVARWQRENGRAEKAAKLQQAIDAMKERHRLYRVALMRSKAKLRMFCGVAVDENGQFLRRRAGSVANWHPDARQALFILADQFNRRPQSYWGQRLLAYKEKLRTTHPVVICAACDAPWEECPEQNKPKGRRKEVKPVATEADAAEPIVMKQRHVRRYTDGHIHKMALWRTVSKFLEWLCIEWMRLNKGEPVRHRTLAPTTGEEAAG